MPLQTDCEVNTKYIQTLGFDTSKLVLNELMSTEEWAQEMVAAPVKAALFLYPIKDFHDQFNKKEEQEQQKQGV